MFQALRNSFLGFGHRIGHAWRDLHGRGMVRLFLFEFVVVMVGVLAAQGLQTWMAGRADEERADAAIARLDREIALALETGILWDAALPCMLERTDSIMRAAAERRVLPAAIYRRPGMWSSSVEPPAQDVVLAMRSRMREDEFGFYELAINHANRTVDRMNELSRSWEQFSRLDPALGEAGPADFAAARDAGATIRSSLRSMRISIDILANVQRNLAIEPARSRDSRRNRIVSPITSCSQLDEGNSIFYTEPDSIH